MYVVTAVVRMSPELVLIRVMRVDAITALELRWFPAIIPSLMHSLAQFYSAD